MVITGRKLQVLSAMWKSGDSLLKWLSNQGTVYLNGFRPGFLAFQRSSGL
jgi:hypothetical protein